MWGGSDEAAPVRTHGFLPALPLTPSPSARVLGHHSHNFNKKLIAGTTFATWNFGANPIAGASFAAGHFGAKLIAGTKTDKFKFGAIAIAGGLLIAEEGY